MSKEYCNAKTVEFMEQFRDEKKSLICRDLLGFDVRRPEDHARPEVITAKNDICPGLVAYAVSMVENMEFE